MSPRKKKLVVEVQTKFHVGDRVFVRDLDGAQHIYGGFEGEIVVVGPSRGYDDRGVYDYSVALDGDERVDPNVGKEEYDPWGVRFAEHELGEMP